MATRKSKDSKNKDRLAGETDIARFYRAAAQDVPPASLDAKILAEAQRAAGKPKMRVLFGGRWAIPFSTAAVIVLSVGVLLLLSEQGALNLHDVPAPMVAQAPQELARSVPATPAASEYELPAEEPPAKVQPALPQTAQGVLAPQAARSATPEAKKAERTAAAPAAAPAQRMAEQRVNVARDATSAKSKLAKEASSMGLSADVIAVQASGSPGAYQFSVGIHSPDKGCSQYADWWEVVSTDGKLLYRRVLLHSHVGEQPFTRSGGPVPIQPEMIVWVRAHMNTGGYGGMAFKGSVKTGFAKTEPPANFAPALAKQPPLPDGCAF
jgi:hypothetical protein